jgi:hypothetical protein
MYKKLFYKTNLKKLLLRPELKKKSQKIFNKKKRLNCIKN